jgi:hypothetical protein
MGADIQNRSTTKYYKKMKKIFIAMVLFCASNVTYSACKQSDIAGLWTTYALTYNPTDQSASTNQCAIRFDRAGKVTYSYCTSTSGGKTMDGPMGDGEAIYKGGACMFYFSHTPPNGKSTVAGNITLQPSKKAFSGVQTKSDTFTSSIIDGVKVQ